LATIKAPPPVPPDAELERMVAEALLGFNQAVRARDFTAFYGKLSDVWKKETTPQRLQQTFQEFLDTNIDISSIKNVKPRVAPSAAVNDRGVLVVAGHYPTQPSQVRFELKPPVPTKQREDRSGLATESGEKRTGFSCPPVYSTAILCGDSEKAGCEAFQQIPYHHQSRFWAGGIGGSPKVFSITSRISL
jgi:hypothetical protein